MKKIPQNARTRLRTYTAAFSAILLNLRWTGLDLRRFCAPGFNCHGCPYATFACPVGVVAYGFSLRELPLLAIGFVLAVGVALGRLLCGYACPFGFFQDLLYKIPFRKLRLPKSARYLKYALLLLLVLALPYLLGYDVSAKNSLFYCRICPKGVLTSSLPYFISSNALTVGEYIARNWLRLGITAITLLGMLSVSRFFCRALCPLGAFWGLTARFSLLRFNLDKNTCIDCGKCDAVCPVELDVRRELGGAECISCGDCKTACPVSCISRKFGL